MSATRSLASAYVEAAKQTEIDGRLETPSSQFSTFTFAEEFAFLFPHVNDIRREAFFHNFLDLYPHHKWTIDEIEDNARYHLDSLFKLRAILEYIVVRFEDVIRSRWMKKSATQRKQILLEAWPGIAPKHRPDLYRYLGSNHYQQNWKDEWAKCPYINLEDLTTSDLVLSFLHSRGHNPPHKFAYTDIQYAPVYTAPETVLPNGMMGLPNYTIALAGRDTPDTYGRLDAWDNAKDALEFRLHGHGLLPDAGLQVLEIQQNIWGFLVSFCKRMLQDFELVNGAPAKPLCPPLTLSDKYITADSVAKAKPYLVPGCLNLARLKTLIHARRSLAEDHIWSLREDPGYFADSVRDYKNYEMRFPSSSTLLRALITDAYYHFYLWSILYRRIASLHELWPEHLGEVVCVRDLPDSSLEAFEETYVLIEITSVEFIKHFSRGFKVMKMRTGATHGIVSSTSSEHMQIRKTYVELLDKLRSKPTRDDFGLHALLDEMEHLTHKHPFLGSELSPWAAAEISDLSILAECQQEIHTYQPLAYRIEYGARQRRPEYIHKWMDSMKDWKAISTAMFTTDKIARLGDLADKKFYYPTDKTPTRKIVDLLRSAEGSLDRFWEAVDKHYLRTVKVTPHDLVRDLLTEGRIVHRTPADLEPELPVKRGKKQSLGPYEPIFETTHEESKQITGIFNKLSLSAKLKPKTRGPATPLPAIPTSPTTIHESISDANQSPPPPPPIIEVDKRAHRVFKALFRSPSTPGRPGEIPWTEFLHAMASTGFSIEKLHGSAWQFTPMRMHVERSIQFHEPHPSSKLPFAWARRIGRRLERTYGWRGEMFCVV
ncbi:hypothetical protein K491DRAFT_24362 [Lophiostoma macrostomum CBS 122681]|uniref:Uncharacterized protein n=1 Tax=Lophiostoma macrostomum CBS 122681 TaxID=1314788 RepID=A0A6A6T123_9PLEO|nr:hypothetical protein K491DRAFT_24362 [Lophiostoma macrostomum CBS 122681]